MKFRKGDPKLRSIEAVKNTKTGIAAPDPSKGFLFQQKRKGVQIDFDLKRSKLNPFPTDTRASPGASPGLLCRGSDVLVRGSHLASSITAPMRPYLEAAKGVFSGAPRPLPNSASGMSWTAFDSIVRVSFSNPLCILVYRTSI